MLGRRKGQLGSRETAVYIVADGLILSFDALARPTRGGSLRPGYGWSLWCRLTGHVRLGTYRV